VRASGDGVINQSIKKDEAKVVSDSPRPSIQAFRMPTRPSYHAHSHATRWCTWTPA
jgi:hypothetical protein